MQTKRCCPPPLNPQLRRRFTKIFLAMRLTVLLLTIFLVHAQASTNAQTVSISGTNMNFKEIAAAVKKQTGYLLFSKKDVVIQLKSVSVSNMPLREFMDMLVKGRELEYSFVNKTIIISPKPPAPKTETLSVSRLLATPIKIRVSDADGKPLSGATVLIKKSRVSGSTDESGVITLDAKEDDVLVITFVGFESKEMKVTTGMLRGELVNIALSAADSKLDEVTVITTGYQTIEKEKSTGAVSGLGSKELSKRNAVNILDNLEGLVPGLVRYQGVTTIRGVSTLRANQGVLVVVDGLPIEGDIADINPYDVESVNVLKDAAAASIYGARASNGVIVVTTKRAKQVGKPVVQASSNITYTEKPDYSYYNLMTPGQQVDWERDYYNWWFSPDNSAVPSPITAFENNIAQGQPIDPVGYAIYRRNKTPGEFSQAALDALLDTYRQNNFAQQYHDQALRNQVIQQYNLAVRTNNGRSQSSLVVNYRTDNGGLINAYARQFNLFYKGSYNVAKWMDAEYGVNSAIGKKRSHNSTFATNAFSVPSYFKLLNDDGSRAYYNTYYYNEYNPLTEVTPGLYSTRFNHLDELSRDYINTSTLNTRYYLNLNFRVLPGLTINPMFQYEDNRTDISNYSEEESFTMRWLHNVYTQRTGTPGNYTYNSLIPKGGKLATTQQRNPSYTARAQANYTREFGVHGITALAGMEFRETRVYGTRGLLLGYDDQLQTQATNNVNFGTLYNVASSFLVAGYTPQQYDYPGLIEQMGLITDTKHRFASAYANLTYTYNRKYNIFGSLRKDYADLFGGDKKYRGRPLWSVGAAWILSQENFLNNIHFVNFLKFRTSYGLTGNIDPTTPSVLAATTGMNNDTQLPNASVTTPPNAQLRWEKTASINLGLDFYLFTNRLRGTLDWYRRKGTDLFAQKRLDPSEGFRNMVINNASMLNNGFELSLNYDWVKSRREDGLTISTGIVASTNKNKITYVDQVVTSPFQLVDGGFKTGYPVRSIFSYRYGGLNDKGQPLFYNKDGVKTFTSLTAADIDALVFSGGLDPKTTISLNNEIRYKGVSLIVYAVYYGGHFYKARPAPTPYQMPLYRALPSYLVDAWTPTNTDTDVPASGAYYQTNLGSGQIENADILVRPADFIKIRNIVLGYDLPRSIAARIRATSAQIRLQVNNPRSVWINQSDVHVDPETGGLPLPTSYVFGINLNF